MIELKWLIKIDYQHIIQQIPDIFGTINNRIFNSYKISMDEFLSIKEQIKILTYGSKFIK